MYFKGNFISFLNGISNCKFVSLFGGLYSDDKASNVEKKHTKYAIINGWESDTAP